MTEKNKYAFLVIERIASTFGRWESKPSVVEKEIYLFLHNLKGTAGTIGMTEIADIAIEKLNKVSESGTKEWPISEWKAFFQDLIDITERAKKEGSGVSKTIKKLELLLDDNVKSETPAIVQSIKTNQPDEQEEVEHLQEFEERDENKVILLIDNDVDFITFMKEKLEKDGYHVIIALTIDKGVELFYTIRPMFVVIDLNFKDQVALATIKQLLAIATHSFTSVAIISNHDDLENRILAYQIGATDFISKPINYELFLAYLKNRLYTQLHVEQKVTVDELTSAYNRVYMDKVISKLLANFNRYDQVFSVVMLDLDFFKKVNDKYGHIIGDTVLKGLVKTINKYKRDTDDLFRFGGEEFVLCLPNTSADEALVIIDRVRKVFAKEKFSADHEDFNVTFSAGITTVAKDNVVKDKLLNQADQALYQSKASGRNCVTIFSSKEELQPVRKLHVMIVDDDPLVRMILERSFQEWEIGNDVAVIVHVFSDGLDFIESGWYNPNDFYVILLDGIMPKMDGVEVLMKVRSKYPVKNVVISMLSARSGEGSIIQALEKGADDYMMKPFDALEVLERMERLVRRMLF